MAWNPLKGLFNAEKSKEKFDKAKRNEIAKETIRNAWEDLAGKRKKEPEFKIDPDEGIIIDIGEEKEPEYDTVMEKYWAVIKNGAVDGKDSIASGLESINETYHSELEALVEKSPISAGIVDGLYETFTNQKPARSEEKDYLSGVKTGDNIGKAISVASFFTGGTAFKLLGATPYIVRTVPAVKDRLKGYFEDAKESVEKKYKE